jgi:hypothetical protein
MLGYLALQARWAMSGSRDLGVSRSVKRLFVWNEHEFKSHAGLKILQLHRLYGFETYVMEEKKYRSSLGQYVGENASIKRTQVNKEFFVWDEDSNAKLSGRTTVYSFGRAFGYDSYWLVEDSEDRRRDTEAKLKASQLVPDHQPCLFHPVNQADAIQYRKFFRYLSKRAQRIDAVRPKDVTEQMEQFLKL